MNNLKYYADVKQHLDDLGVPYVEDLTWLEA